jgi:hypothetical protein
MEGAYSAWRRQEKKMFPENQWSTGAAKGQTGKYNRILQ